MDKTYQPQDIEIRLAKHWEAKGFYRPNEDSEKSSYCIMIPPPNVTGSLHMGHGFQHTLMDGLIRYHRMKGDNTLWQMGTDHAGIATQMVVERKLAKENLSRHDLGREKFVDKIWEWKATSGGMISQQIRRMGSSVDWQTERFTMDPHMSKAVSQTFIRLFDEDLIYRGKRLVNWDPKFQTAISDLEVLNAEEEGKMWYFRYPLVDKPEQHIVIATTRPETLLGDTAVAVHPEDDRYQHLIGHYIKLPLTDRTIPIIADEYVDPEFGTGCVKITPAHDFNDNAVGKRHDLPLINIMTKTATLNENAPEKYQGLDRFIARAQIVEDMEALGLVEKIEKHTLKVPRGDRSGDIIEPLLTDQWFVRANALAEPALAAVAQGEIRFVPENWKNTYDQWLNNIEDWCISRQLWWGHRIPAWYDDKGEIYVGDDEAAVREKYHLAQNHKLTQDEDVLDTWFSSALWPFATLGWPDETKYMEDFYPNNVLITGFDIIFFWVARMVMMGLKFTGKVPFHEVYITGLIRDSEGQKMSKSKGNVLDPLDLINGISLEALIEKRTANMMQPHLAEKITAKTKKAFPDGIPAFGTDALRFTFYALASTSRDINFDLKRLEGYRNFCNKLWNAARFVLMHTENDKPLNSDADIKLSAADEWILTKLQNTIGSVHKHFKTYRYDHIAQAIYDFSWREYCDWYLELAKATLNDKDADPAYLNGTKHTLLNVLETLMRLIHPLMPFMSEEIWQKVAPLIHREGETIMQAPYPETNPKLINEQSSHDIDWVRDAITSIRTIKAEMNIAPNHGVPVIVKSSESVKSLLNQQQHLFKTLAKVTDISYLAPDETAPAAAKGLVGETELLIPLAGLIDKEAEVSRLKKGLTKVLKDLERCQGKLNNDSFVKSAPAQVVEKEKARLQEFTDTKARLEQSLTEMEAL